MTTLSRHARWLAGCLLVFPVLVLLGCTSSSPRGLVLISVDTLRADHLGCYGHSRETSPGLDDFAARGVLFDEAVSPSSWTLPAHVSLLTGLYPSRHGVRAERHALGLDAPTLAAHLSELGFDTGAVVNNAYLSRRFGLSRGFREYREVRETHSAEGVSGPITDLAIAWLEERRDRQSFLFVHYNDVHSDYRSLPEYERLFVSEPGRLDGSTAQLREVAQDRLEIDERDADHLSRLYDAGIRQLDADLARLLEFLRSDPSFERYVVVVTSDHGEEFLEHGGLLHGATLYDEIVRVPLILGGAEIPEGVRVSGAVSLVDVMPTVLGILGVPNTPVGDGLDLRPAWANGRAAERPLFGQTSGEDAPDRKRSVRRGRYKLVLDLPLGYRELYDLEHDPGETVNIAADRPDVVESLSGELADFMKIDRTGPAVPPPDADAVERLEALGYL